MGVRDNSVLLRRKEWENKTEESTSSYEAQFLKSKLKQSQTQAQLTADRVHKPSE